MPARFRLPRALALAAGLAALAACGTLPDLGAREDPPGARDYPAILPLGPLLAQAEGGVIAPDLTASLEARGAALRARAAALKRPVIERATRARLTAALARRRGG